MTTSDEQTRNDRECERNPDFDCGAFTRLAEDINQSPNLLDGGPDHVHSNAATGNLCDFLRSRETGEEDQVQSLAIAHLFELLGSKEPILQGLLFYPNHVDAGSVIAHLDVDLASFVVRTQRHCALGWFARGETLLRRLNAVITRVSYQMD